MPGCRTASAITGETAAARIQLEFSESDWLFRRLEADFSIDAQAEHAAKQTQRPRPWS